MSSVRRRLLRPSMVGLVVAVAVLAVLYGSGLVADQRGSAAESGPVLPTTIAPYSLFAGMLSAHRFEAASLLYQNGYGVEFMDNPQAVLLGADGSTYRRLGEAEASSVAVDQGDPATSVLSPDGTFVVIGSSAPTSRVEVVTLGDGRRRVVSTQAGHTTLPLAIGADGQTVLLATSSTTVKHYAPAGENELGLARLDLATGAIRGYPTITHVQGAALSPDGSRLAVASQGAVRVLDTATGAARTSFPGFAVLDGDAWSPDGRRLALVGQSRTEADSDGAGEDLVVVDVSGAKPVERRHPLGASSYGGSAIGWRDDATVLVHTQTGEPEDNTSAMLWVDAATGAQTSFATYRPDGFTGAAMGGADAARNLVMTWHVADRPVDRGTWPLPLGLGAAVLAGLLAMALARLLLPQARPGSVHQASERDTPAAHHEPPRLHA